MGRFPDSILKSPSRTTNRRNLVWNSWFPIPLYPGGGGKNFTLKLYFVQTSFELQKLMTNKPLTPEEESLNLRLCLGQSEGRLADAAPAVPLLLLRPGCRPGANVRRERVERIEQCADGQCHLRRKFRSQPRHAAGQTQGDPSLDASEVWSVPLMGTSATLESPLK